MSESSTHSPTPVDADPTPIHAAVDALASTLHEFVAVACGVRSEFGAQEADEDPRLLALEKKVGTLNAALYDAFHDTLGLHPNLTTSVWDPHRHHPGVGHGLPGGAFPTETYYLGFVVAAPPPGAPMTLDGVIDILDGVGRVMGERMQDAGYEVIEWATARGDAPEFGPDVED